MADLVELFDAEHLHEYARQMVRCDAELDASSAYFAQKLSLDQSGQIPAEMNRLTEMVASLTSSQANIHASVREEG